MRLSLRMLFVAALLACASVGPARAATTVQVLETHPAGSSVALAPNQRFSLRLAYSTDTPAGIWIAPYYRGQRVHAGTSPSRRHSGSGETIAWFFFMKPGDQVDEIRITAGDGGTASTPVVATYRVHVINSASTVASEPAPAWVNELRERERIAQQQEMQAHRNAPMSAGDTAIAVGFMLAVFTIGLGGMAAPVWQFFRWRGGWRFAAGVPAALAAFVVLRIVFDGLRDPTSHNLWPFEVLMAGAFCAVAAAVLAVARRLLVAR